MGRWAGQDAPRHRHGTPPLGIQASSFAHADFISVPPAPRYCIARPCACRGGGSLFFAPHNRLRGHIELRRASSAYYISCRQATRSQGSAHVRVELWCFRNVLAQASGFGRWSVTRCSTAGHLVRSGVEKLEADGVANMELSPSRTQTSSICSRSTRTSTLRRRPILAVRHDASTRSKACHEGVRLYAPK